MIGKLITAVVVVFTLLLQTQVQAMQEHGQTQQGSRCGNPAAMPSLDCGLAPSITVDQQGRLWAAWGYGGHVYVNYSDDQGENYSIPVAVNRVPEAVSARGENRPKVLIDGKGGIHISWTKSLSRKYTGDIRYSYSADGGASYREPVTVNDDGELTGHRFEALAVSDEGHVFIAWLDKRDREQTEKSGGKYTGAALYYSHKAADQQQFSSNLKIRDHSCECCRVAMELDANQLPVVMWRHVYGTKTRDHGLVRFTSADSFADPVRVSFDNWQIDACPHHGPALSIDSKGRYHSVWFNDGDERHGLFYGFSTDQGEHFSEPMSFGDYDRQAAHPDVLAINDHVYLVWKEFDGERTQILLKRSDNGGQGWSTKEVIGSTSETSDYPFLVQAGDQVLISWQTDEKGFQLIPIDGDSQHVH